MSKEYITHVAVVEDDPIFAKALKFRLEQEGNYEVIVYESGHEFLREIESSYDIVSIDCNLPDVSGLEILNRVLAHDESIPCLMLSGQEEIDVVVQCYRSGARDYIVKNQRAADELINSIKKFTSQVNLKKELEDLREYIADRNKYKSLIGDSNALLKIIRLLQKIEKTSMIVLITGESGTGKEVVAKTIHYNSSRRKEPFVAVNMAAIPMELIESELFGHEKGAFTGADSRRIGKFEESNHGTIFLDEIGEMDMNLQTKLLRVLQESTITRVGSNKEMLLDVRVLAATNKNLLEMVKEGKFREDLYYRLQGFLLHLPPLRDRGNDVILLAKHFLVEFITNNRLNAKTLGKDTLEKLLKYQWPGNVRELKNVIERAAIIADEEEITADDLIFS